PVQREERADGGDVLPHDQGSGPMMLDPFQTAGSSPPARRSEEPNPGPITRDDHVDSAPSATADDNERRELMRPPLVESFLWRNCAATRFHEDRTLVTRRWRRQ